MGFWGSLSPHQMKAALKKLGHKMKTRKKRKQGPRVAEDTFCRTVTRSLGGFALGMTLASIYGAMVVLGQGYNIWYCLLSTITLALALGFGMAFSFKVRVTVLLLLPQIFSSKCPTGQDRHGDGKPESPAPPAALPMAASWWLHRDWA